MNTHVAIDLAKLETSATKTPVRDYIHLLAAQHNLRHVRTHLDEWCEAVTRHSGDDVVLDETELLILELKQAGLVVGADGTRLHAAYLRERGT